MLTLGISAFYHDSSAALVFDSTVLAAVQEERFSRIKYDATFPTKSIQYCLAHANVTVADLNSVSFFENPNRKYQRQTWQHSLNPNAQIRFSPDDIAEHLYQRLGWTHPIDYVDHHYAHAASAFFLSGMNRAAVLVSDGVGEWETISYWLGEGPSLRCLQSVQFPHSLGLFYGCITAFLGFQPNSDEYKVMGLAAHGVPLYKRQFLDILSCSDGQIFLDLNVLNFLAGDDYAVSGLESFLRIPRRRASEAIEPLHANIAASAQAAIEAILSKMLDWLFEASDSINLCLAGGVALNCVANARTFERSHFKKMFIQPAAGDAGTAIGAALATAVKAIPTFHNNQIESTQLGPAWSDDEIVRMLDCAGIPSNHYRGDEYGFIQAVAQRIAEGATVGWFQGRMEFGPRALGARSILADPRRSEMKDRLNHAIKLRESFRPFAPSVAEERASQYFQIDRPSPFMIDIFRVRVPETIPAVTHVDGTARVHTVSRRAAPRYAALIAAFEELTGVAVLLNTSFNLSDEPIVCTPIDAIRTFGRSALDYLCIGTSIVSAAQLPSDVRKAAIMDQWRFLRSASAATPDVYSFF